MSLFLFFFSFATFFFSSFICVILTFFNLLSGTYCFFFILVAFFSFFSMWYCINFSHYTDLFLHFLCFVGRNIVNMVVQSIVFFSMVLITGVKAQIILMIITKCDGKLLLMTTNNYMRQQINETAETIFYSLQ